MERRFGRDGDIDLPVVVAAAVVLEINGSVFVLEVSVNENDVWLDLWVFVVALFRHKEEFLTGEGVRCRPDRPGSATASSARWRKRLPGLSRCCGKDDDDDDNPSPILLLLFCAEEEVLLSTKAPPWMRRFSILLLLLLLSLRALIMPPVFGDFCRRGACNNLLLLDDEFTSRSSAVVVVGLWMLLSAVFSLFALDAFKFGELLLVVVGLLRQLFLG